MNKVTRFLFKLSLCAMIAPLMFNFSSISARKSSFVIRSCDINRNGFVIKKSGEYCLAEDTVYSPCDGNPAIRISASNVTLDLKGRTLSQINKDVANINGILIDCGAQNVIIKNGTVRDFSQAGILACPASFVAPLDQVAAQKAITEHYDKKLHFYKTKKQDKNHQPARTNLLQECVVAGPPVTDLAISKIRALNNGTPLAQNASITGMGGIVIFNAQDTLIEHCEAQQNAFAGVTGYDVTKFTVDGCHCDDNVSAIYLGDFFFAFSAGLAIIPNCIANDVLVKNSTFNRNVSIGGATGIFVGSPVTGAPTNNITIDSVQTNDMQTTITTPQALGPTPTMGIQVDFFNNAVINNVQSTGLSLNASSTTTAGFFYLSNICVESGNNVSISNTQVAGSTILATTTQSKVMQLWALDLGGVNNFSVTNTTFTNFSSTYNGTPAQVITQAANIIGCSNGVIRNCQFGNCTSSTNDAAPVPMISIGLLINFSSDILAEDCVASGNNQAATSQAGFTSIAAGFNASLFSERIVFRRCVASNNTATNSGASNAGIAYGFSTTGSQPGTTSGQIVFDSCVAEGNTGASGLSGGFDINNLANSKVLNCLADGNVIGINVSEGMPTTTINNIIAGNTLLGNQQFGIQDTTSETSNSYYSNRAQNNGTPSSFNANYSGAVFPTIPVPTPVCDLSCAFPGAGLIPVRTWVLPNPPCPVNTNCAPADTLDNISIIS